MSTGTFQKPFSVDRILETSQTINCISIKQLLRLTEFVKRLYLITKKLSLKIKLT